MVRFFILFLLLFASFQIKAQLGHSVTDTVKTHSPLPEIIINTTHHKTLDGFLPEVQGTSIFAGKKNHLIRIEDLQANKSLNTMRQILAKVPGIHIWESDPSGIQVGIAARGLSPNRSWEFNVRQNGNDIAADPYGYPEAYYNPPMEAVKNIEIVRGQGSLQYGPQFGGLVNYVLKDGASSKKKTDLEFQQTIGGNRLSSSFLGFSAKSNHSGIYSFYHQRSGEGWRNNSQFETRTGYVKAYHSRGRFKLETDLTYSNLLTQQPGGLPDSLVFSDARQSMRSRNWMKINWLMPSLQLQYKWKEGKEWNMRLFGIFGQRNSLAFLRPINIPDSLSVTSFQYSNRVLQKDEYKNAGLESRFITRFKGLNKSHRFTAGVRIFQGATQRLADGSGSTGSDYDETLVGIFGKDLGFSTFNAALFSECIFQLTDRWILIPGIRLESVSGSASGRNGWNSDGQPIMLNPVTRGRKFILAGIGSEYHINAQHEFYASFAQAYRPVQFSNLLAPPGSDVVDPDLQDAKGFNFDFGVRGRIKNRLTYDVSFYQLDYNNRIGTIQVNEAGNNYRLITNIGNSFSRGLELLADGKIWYKKNENKLSELSVFLSYSLTQARYSNWVKDPSFRGKRVENAPQHILRYGIQWINSGFKAGLQGNYTSSTYSDAANTALPNLNFQIGKIPAYHLIDLTIGYQIDDEYFIQSGINNITDRRYFTRRAGGLPGPGALPGDGINYFISFGKTF